MDATSFMSENAATGAFARINLGDGSLGSVGANTGDADGTYNIANIGNPDPGSLFGSPTELFPRETNFNVGSLTYDENDISGIGVETTAITSLDLGEFWTADPERTAAGPSAPTVVSDISDFAIGIWFFNGPGGISFGGLDAFDTVTFTDGVLTSIDLNITTAFTIDVFGSALSYDGIFSITGSDISYQINDTESTFIGDSTFVADVSGTVNAVVPEPTAGILFGASLTAIALFRRRR